MSNAVFPKFVGLGWSIFKRPTFNTKVQRAVSGKELRAAYYYRPIWKFTLTYEVLRGDSVNAELQSIMAFYNLRQGAYDSFLLRDDSDYSVNDQPIGVGNGTQTVFPLLRAFGGWTEQIGYADVITNIRLNGTVTGAYTVSTDKTYITFTTPPGSGVSVTWTGTFYFRVRFEKDEAEFENFMKDLWSFKKIDLTGVI